MKKNFKKLFLLVAVIATAVVCFAFSASAKTVAATGQCGDNVYWEYDESTGELVISGSGAMTEYKSIDGSPFYDSDIKSVIIGEGVKTIARFAFASCGSLEYVTISDSVKEIGSYAFHCCYRLVEIVIPDSVTTIGSYAFAYCAYGLESITIPDSVTKLGQEAFTNCESLESVIIGDGLKVIEISTFYYCENLENVVLGDSVKEIEKRAFYNCESLRNITLPDGLTIIGYQSFLGCGLVNINIPDSVTSIGESAFRGSGVDNIRIPYGVKKIEVDTFYSCHNLKKIYIPDSVTEIDNFAFVFCDNLENVYYGGTKEQWKNIRMGSSNGCLKGANVYYDYCYHINKMSVSKQNPTCLELGYTEGIYCLNCEIWIEGHEEINKLNHNDKNLDKLCDDCGSYAEKLYKSGFCGDNVTYNWYEDGMVIVSGGGPIYNYDNYYDSPFYESDIKQLIINDGVTSIGDFSFLGCDSLMNIIGSEDVKTIGKFAFQNCASLTELIIGTEVTTIDIYAFSGCTNLVSISIPSSINTIGDAAFSDCEHLTDVYYGGTQLQWINTMISTIYNNNLTGANIHYNSCLHTEKNSYPKQNPTCTEVGYTEGLFCNVCNKWRAGHEEIPKIPHSYTKYTSNKNATLLADGTKTALCDYGCGNKKTVTDKGSKLTLGKASDLKATQTTSSITLTWSKGKNATGYRLYYKLEGDINWRNALKYTTKTTYTFSNLPAGTLYTFAVKSVGKVGSSTVYGSYVTVATATKPLKPVKVIASQNTSAIKLTWSASKGADGYRIYYKSGGKWKTAVSSIAVTTYTFKGLKAGTKYTFAVKPYIKTADGVIWGEYAQFTTATKPVNPTLKVTAPSKGKLTVNWKAVSGAESYQLWYKTGNGSYKLYKTYTKAGTYTFSNLKSGTKYTFAVRAVIKTSGDNVRSGYKAVSATVK